MDFVAIIVFLILYYIRPQEWIGFVTGLQPVKWSIILGLISMVLRKRGFHVRELLQTPHDWMMLLFLMWITFSNDAPISTFLNNYNFFVFYVVTVQALSSIKRAQTFLGWWTFMIMVVAGLAVASQYGFDLMDSSDVTRWRMKNRLVLNTSIFNNPNALGHSVYPAIVLLYFLLFWRRPIFMKIAMIPLTFVPFFCIYLTASKGAFIAGFVTIVAALIFGRPKVVQITVLVVAMTLGWTILWSMPRMTELNKASTDQAIQGRVAAFKYGLTVLHTNIRGVGISQFAVGMKRTFRFGIAPHSSYVQVGGELGWPGLFLFVGIMYCCLRTLFNSKTTDVTEERVRRILFVLLVSYAVSSWMVNWPWRATFFLTAGVIAAFHRLMLAKNQAKPVETEPQAELLLAPALIGLQPVPALPTTDSTTFNQAVLTPPLEKKKPLLTQEFPDAMPFGLRWNKFGWVDLLMMIGLTWVTVRFWEHLITRM